MSRFHHDTTNSVSLFPFLAVLVCAMGALIFLLLVTTHRLRQQAISRAEQERQQQTPTSIPAEPIILAEPMLPSLIPLPKPDRRSQFSEPSPVPRTVNPNIELRATIARLSRERDNLRGNLDRGQQAIAALQQQQNTAEEAVAQARSKRALIKRQQELERIAQHSLLKRQTGLTGKIRQADKHLKTIRQKNATAKSRYAVLPFDAKTGTTRRPILIECTREGLRFLPEDVTLQRDDLDAFTVGYNPLLAGTRSLIRYWSGFDGSARKRPSLPSENSGGRKHKSPMADGLKPYVLLIVRPDGSLPFYMARKYLARLGEPFGYELLETGRKLATPPVDLGAQMAVREAIDAVFAERSRLIATIHHDRRGSGRGLRTEGRGTRSGSAAASGGGSSRYGSQLGGRPGIEGRQSGSQSGGSLAGGTQPTGNTARSTLASGQFGQRSSEHRSSGPQQTGRDPSGRYSSGQHSSGQHSSGQQQAGQQQAGGQQAGGRQSRSGTRTRSGRVATNVAGRPAGNHNARGGNTPEPFPRFGPSGANSSRSARRMDQPRRWGHVGGRTGIGLERNVAVAISAQRITVGSRLIIPVGRGETQKQLIDRVAAAIDREASAWGPPPSGFYWVPNIQFAVRPGGNQFYERLNPTLRRWGLSTSVRFPVGSSNNFGDGG